MGVTENEKQWKSDQYQKKAREAMKKVPNPLKATLATNGGPTWRYVNPIAKENRIWLVGQSKNKLLGLSAKSRENDVFSSRCVNQLKVLVLSFILT